MSQSTYQPPAVGQRWVATRTGKSLLVVTVLSEDDERARNGKCIEVRAVTDTWTSPVSHWYTRAEFLGNALPEIPDPDPFGPDPFDGVA